MGEDGNAEVSSYPPKSATAMGDNTVPGPVLPRNPPSLPPRNVPRLPPSVPPRPRPNLSRLSPPSLPPNLPPLPPGNPQKTSVYPSASHPVKTRSSQTRIVRRNHRSCNNKCKLTVIVIVFSVLAITVATVYNSLKTEVVNNGMSFFISFLYQSIPNTITAYFASKGLERDK